jgi:hypothetical protein
VTETDGDAVPGIAIGKHHRQVNEFLRMHIDTQYAAVDLRGAQADQRLE